MNFFMVLSPIKEGQNVKRNQLIEATKKEIENHKGKIRVAAIIGTIALTDLETLEMVEISDAELAEIDRISDHNRCQHGVIEGRFCLSCGDVVPHRVKSEAAPMTETDPRWGDPELCEHANEVPVTCPCEPGCYCKGRTCPSDEITAGGEKAGVVATAALTPAWNKEQEEKYKNGEERSDEASLIVNVKSVKVFDSKGVLLNEINLGRDGGAIEIAYLE
jgi:hypothetical protein